MNGDEIRRVCIEDPYVRPLFRGVFALNELPNPLEPRGIYFMNLQPYLEPGNHWTVIQSNIEATSICTYFDSFAQKPPPEIIENLFSQTKEVYYNDGIVQNPLSQVCGHISILIAKYWARGYTTIEILTQHLYNSVRFPFINDVLAETIISDNSSVESRPIIPPTSQKL